MRFQLLTIVRLVSPEQAAPDTPDDDRIQADHIAYLTGLREQGKILLNGPVRRLDDARFRGMSIYSVGHEEARALAQGGIQPSRRDGLKSSSILGSCRRYP